MCGVAHGTPLNGDLVAEMCQNRADKKSADYLILGVSQGILATQAIDAGRTPPVSPIVCYGPTATGAQVIDTVCKYAIGHPELATADVGLIALKALAESFPCK